MSAFEFFFSFYGLILGLSVVEVITGLTRVFKQRQRVRIGWLTPLLGLFVLLDIASFWTAAWFTMQGLQLNYGLLILGLMIAAIYYASASLITPDSLDEWPDFDVFYDRHKAYVLSGIIAANLLAFEGIQALLTPGLWIEKWNEPMYWLAFGPNYLLLLGLVLIRHRRVNIVLLGVGIAVYCAQAIMTV